MDKNDIISAIQALDALEIRWKYNKIETYFPDYGPLCRSNYPKQMELMTASINHRLLGFIGGNGSGKSLWNAITTYFHCSGRYPNWWEGHKFKRPINAWMAARETKALREGIQEILFGGFGDDDIGTGVIRREDLLDEKGNIQTWAYMGQPNTVGQCLIRHYTDDIFDGYSKIDFKTYAQGWKEFQGPTRDLITLDEEPDDAKIIAECIGRLRGKDGGEPGHLLATFTPTDGFSNTYLMFVPNGVIPASNTILDSSDEQKYTVAVEWKIGTNEGAPHLSEDWKRSAIAQWKLSDPNNIEARMSGKAAMGSGRVYPIDESFVVVPKFRIPAYWPKAFGMDPGYANFALIWLTQDPNTNVVYVYDEYKYGKVNYAIHVDAVKNRGDWIGGGIDPHEAVKPRDTGETVQSYFESYNINLMAAKGDPDALRLRIRAGFDSGSIKIMDNCVGLLNEIRTYRYDAHDPNRIAKDQEDHRCDAMLYGYCAFDYQKRSYSEYEDEIHSFRHKQPSDDSERNPITGY